MATPKHKRPELTRREYEVIRWAVNEAAAWRGALAKDTSALEAFDHQVAFAKEILKKIKPLSLIRKPYAK